MKKVMVLLSLVVLMALPLFAQGQADQGAAKAGSFRPIPRVGCHLLARGGSDIFTRAIVDIINAENLVTDRTSSSSTRPMALVKSGAIKWPHSRPKADYTLLTFQQRRPDADGEEHQQQDGQFHRDFPHGGRQTSDLRWRRISLQDVR